MCKFSFFKIRDHIDLEFYAVISTQRYVRYFFRVHQASLVFLVLLVFLVRVAVVVWLAWVLVKKAQWAMGMNIEMSQKKMTSV